MVSSMCAKQAGDNMRRLLALNLATAESDQDIEVIAELLRQLGRFDEAISSLDGHCGGMKGLLRPSVIRRNEPLN